MNNDAIEARGAVGVALAALSHQGADGTRTPAGTAAAGRVLSIGYAIIIAGADDAGIELGELAVTVCTTAPPLAWIEHRAVAVEFASSGVTLALIAC